MKTYFWILLCFLAPALRLEAQVEMAFERGCNFATDVQSLTITTFNADPQALQIVAEILRIDSIKLQDGKWPFILKAADVKNAQATKKDKQRYLLYSDVFMQDFKKSAQTKWSAYFVFAHEIAHHVLNHNLAEPDCNKRKLLELAADQFAAMTLACLRVRREDALAAIRTLAVLPEGKQAKCYPAVTAREEAISERFEEERVRLKSASTPVITDKTPPAQHVQVALDPVSFNRWNRLSPMIATAYLTAEKVIINFKMPAQCIGRMINIQLCSNDPNIHIVTLKNAGTMLATAGDKTVEWNHDFDEVTQDLTKPYLLRFYVYEINDLPKSKVSPKTKKNCWILAGAGLATGVAGYVPFMTGALSQHEKYKEHLLPTDAFYTQQGVSRESYYTKADQRYIGAQIMMYTGGALMAGSLVWSLVEKSQARREFRRTICAAPTPRWKLEPMFGFNEAGLKLRF